MILSSLFTLSFLLLAFRRLLRLGQYFQQEEYDGARFVRWWWRERVFDTRVTAGLLVIIFFNQLSAGNAALSLPPLLFLLASNAYLLTPLLFVIAALTEPDPTKEGKKKLVLTARARRIFGLALLLLTPGAVWATRSGLDVLFILILQALPLLLVLANALLAPFERAVRARFTREAQEKLAALRPQVIAVAGSFGKTSVKHILGHILGLHAPTLFTPGSVNTDMGIVRVIREQLNAQHTYFIVEMGAYAKGSVARLCRLVPPDFGIITALGPEHLERFKTVEAVAEAEFELAQAVRAQGGACVTFARALEFAAGQEARAQLAEKLVTVGAEADAACRILEVQHHPHGVALRVVWRGAERTLIAPLHGPAQAENVALAFTAACTLGLPEETVVLALRSVPPIKHRLEVQRRSDGVTMIDDAYNSNPDGFAAALEVLDRLGRAQGGRRILITPGMVELGAQHEAEHARLGALAAKTADIVLAVAPQRIRAFTEAFARSAPEKTLLELPRFADAAAWMAQHLKSNDVVLLENDLPDLYEKKLRI